MCMRHPWMRSVRTLALRNFLPWASRLLARRMIPANSGISSEAILLRMHSVARVFAPVSETSTPSAVNSYSTLFSRYWVWLVITTAGGRTVDQLWTVQLPSQGLSPSPPAVVGMVSNRSSSPNRRQERLRKNSKNESMPAGSGTRRRTVEAALATWSSPASAFTGLAFHGLRWTMREIVRHG